MELKDLSATGLHPHAQFRPPLFLRWKYKTGGPITASPIVVGGKVFVGSHDGIFYALNAKAWGEIWRFEAGLPIRYAAVYWNGNVYFIASGRGISQLYALNAETGDLIWQVRLASWTASAPRADRGVVFVGLYPAKISLFDALTGRVRSEANTRVRIGGVDYLCLQGRLLPSPPSHVSDAWQEKLPYSTSIPVVANGVAYVGTNDGVLYALQPPEWEILWRFPTQGALEAPAALSPDALFVSSRDGYVYALDAEERDFPEPPESGIVTRNGAPVVEMPSREAKVLLQLQDGVRLPIRGRQDTWYQVELPNGLVAWMAEDDFAEFTEQGDVAFNEGWVEHLESLELPQGAEYPVWSPDGQFIAFLRRLNLSSQFWVANELWVADAQLQSLRKLARGIFYNPHVSWSLDSRWLTFETLESDIAYVWIVRRSGQGLTRLTRGDAPAFSPRAHRIVFRRWVENQDELWMTTINGAEKKRLYTVPIEGTVRQFTYLEPPIWSPDGTMIAFGVDGQHYSDGKSRILLIDMQGKLVQQVLTQSGSVHSMRWSPQMRFLAFVLTQNPNQDLDPALDQRLNVKDLSVPDAPVALDAIDGSWSPDGTWLAYIEREPCEGLDWKIMTWNVITNRRVCLARVNAPLRSIQWFAPDTLALWATSGYIREGKFQPALTRGWKLKLNLTRFER